MTDSPREQRRVAALVAQYIQELSGRPEREVPSGRTEAHEDRPAAARSLK